MVNGELKAEPIELPVYSYYPALEPFVVEETLQKAHAAVETAKESLASAAMGDAAGQTATYHPPGGRVSRR